MSEATSICDAQHVTYSHRVYDPDSYDWCIVPETGYDVIVLAGLAVVVACLCQGRLSNLMVLIAGGVLQGILFPLNLGRLSNSVALWLNIEPYELFFYVFLPPLLLDAAVKLDFFLFRKVAIHCIALAFLVVAGSCALLIPVMLYIFQLQQSGWQWPHAALFGSMLASTDAVAIVATMKSSGGPHHLSVLLEGESLLNDATSITLFLVFLKEVQDLQSQAQPVSVGGKEFGEIVRSIIWLSVGGFLIGLAFGIAMRWMLRFLRQRDAGRDQQICVTLAAAYLSFYVANSPAQVSGVIAVVTYGLYGAYTSTWDMDVHVLESGAFDSFYESLAFLVNGIIFFYSGVSCVNFVVRSSQDLYLNSPISEAAAALWRLPLIYIIFNLIRFIIIFMLRPLFKMLHRDLSTSEVVFASVAGLRGSVSLIMAQAFVTESATATAEARMIKAELVLWVAGFVLLSLIINAPLLPWVLRLTKLNIVPEGKLRMRRWAVHALEVHKEDGLQQLKDDPDEMLRGVDWSNVTQLVDMKHAYTHFQNPDAADGTHMGWRSWLTLGLWRDKQAADAAPALQSPLSGHHHHHHHGPSPAYDPHAYWNKTQSSNAASSSDLSDVSSNYSNSDPGSETSHAEQPQGDSASLAAAVAAVDSAAEAALEADAALELPFLPEGAADSITAAALLQAVPPAMTALQNGISDLASAIKDLLVPEQATEQAAVNPELGSSDLTEVSIIATASTAALNAEPDSAANAAAADASEVQSPPCSVPAQQKSAAIARQKSRTEKRPKLLLLDNGVLMPLPSVSLQSGIAASTSSSAAAESKLQIASALRPTAAAALPMLSAGNSKEQTADVLKGKGSSPVVAVADTVQGGNSISKTTVMAAGTGGVNQAKTANKATFAVSDESLTTESSARHASVTFKGNDKQHSPAARSKSFSPGSAGGSPVIPKGGTPAGSPAPQSAFSKAAQSQIRQHVELSGASRSAQSTTGHVASQLLDQLKGLRHAHSSHGDLRHAKSGSQHADHSRAPSEAGSHAGHLQEDEIAVAEMRVRLLAGLKRYLHGKRLNGLLSSQGLRVLDNACETAAEHPQQPLDVWTIVERDCRGSWAVKLVARVVYQLRRLDQKLQAKLGRQKWLLWPLSWAIRLGNKQLSNRLLLACEVGTEFMCSLTYAHQVQWLQHHRPSHPLLAEVHQQSQEAWAFIIAREVEAPQRFQAIQTHRAAQALLHQQGQYVAHLLDTAVVDEEDGHHLLRPIRQRERLLTDTGPTWRTPSVAGVLRNLPFMRHAPPQALEVLLQNGRLKMGHKQQPLRSKGEAGGAFVVISGIVRLTGQTAEGVPLDEAYLAAGAMYGVYMALTGLKLPGQVTAVAEGNALGKGALVFHLSSSALQTLQNRAAGHTEVQLELHRLAAQEVLQRIAPDLTALVSAILRTYARFSPVSVNTDTTQDASHFTDASAAALTAFQPKQPSPTAGQSIESVGVMNKEIVQAEQQQPMLDEDAQMGITSGTLPLEGKVTSRFDQASVISVDSLAAEDSQQQLLSDTAQMSSSMMSNRRTSRFSQLPSVLSDVPIAQLPFEPMSPNAQPLGEAAEAPLPVSAASIRFQAWQLQQQLVQDMKQGRLVMLGANETMQQASHCVVLQGSVTLRGQTVSGATAPGKSCDYQYQSPAVLPWIPMLKRRPAGISLTACSQGTVLLVALDHGQSGIANLMHGSSKRS